MYILLATVSLSALTLIDSQAPVNQVAFTAALTHHQNFKPGDPIVYNNVITNIGNAYDNTTGEFTCPQTGIYVFQFHATTRQNHILDLALYQDYILRAAAYAHTDSDWASAGNNAVLHLTNGDQVRVQAGSEVTYLYGSKDEVYCTFSGYLISASHDESPIVG